MARQKGFIQDPLHVQRRRLAALKTFYKRYEKQYADDLAERARVIAECEAMVKDLERGEEL